MTYHIRRKDRAITDPSTIEAIIRQHRYAVIALTALSRRQRAMAREIDDRKPSTERGRPKCDRRLPIADPVAET